MEQKDKKIINVTKSSMPSFEEYCEEISSLWDTRWLTNNGIKHKELEAELCKRFGVSHVSLTVNGHAALEIAIEALGIKGEIITTPFTFVSTTSSIVKAGCIPVFCDINENNLTIDVDKIEPMINKNTVAILPVHVYGNICDVDRIEQIAKKHNLKVIYDAAHAFHETYEGRNVAQFGDISIFSFHATKVFNTIEGGCLAYKDSNLVSIIDQLRDFGITSDETVIEIPAGNHKMNEFQAAMGLCNLRHLESEIGKRARVVKRYLERLREVRGIRIYFNQESVAYNYSYFPITLTNFILTRDEVILKLKKYGINARKYFYPLTSQFRCFSHYKNSNDTPIARKYAESTLTLPLFADLDLSEVDFICDILLK